MKQYRSIHAYVCGEKKSLNFNCMQIELLKDTTLAVPCAQSIEASLGRVSSTACVRADCLVLVWAVVPCDFCPATRQSVYTVHV